MKKVREGHIPIPSIAWVIVGAAIAIFAKYTQLKDPDSTFMLLFFYLGIIITVFGLGKVVVKQFVSKEQQTMKGEERRYDKQLRQQEHAMQEQHQHPARHNIISCPKCGTRHYTTSNFCHKCGARLK
ncbi:zinc ribbon domain-containing protein [Candidatus Woesearchaeota archaeon]|nr:zinc ribbon domain-containing protein [Candidatus Woesearchaeota archaeon]